MIQVGSFHQLQLSSFQPPTSHPLHLPAPPPILSVPLFLFPSANKLCMPTPTHGVLHCCTICSKLLLPLSSPFHSSPLNLSPSRLLSFSLLISRLTLSLSLSLSLLTHTHTHITHTQTQLNPHLTSNHTPLLSLLVGPALLSQSSLQLNSTPEASLQYSASYHSNQTLALSDSISAATPQRSGQVGGAVHSYNQVGNTAVCRW